MGAILEKAVFDGQEIGLITKYFDGVNLVFKKHGAQYFKARGNPYSKSWRICRDEFKTIAPLLFDDLGAAAEKCGLRIEGPKEFAAVVNAAIKQPKPRAFIEGLHETIYPVDGVSLIEGDFNPGLVILLKKMGGKYFQSSRSWMVDSSPEMLKFNILDALNFAEDQIEIREGTFEFIDGVVSARPGTIMVGTSPSNDDFGKTGTTGAAIFLALQAPITSTGLGLEQAKAGAYGLYDYQIDGVAHLIARSSALLADDMGLGKTRQSVVAAHIIIGTTAKVIIASPASLTINWSREIRAIAPSATISINEYDPDATWCIFSYESLDKIAAHAGRFAVMIIDEAHLLKEPTTRRTRISFEIAAKVQFRFILTGTPILNRESEIHTLLRLSGHPIGMMPLKEFEDQFAGNPDFRRQLNLRIKEWMLRRKKDVLKSLKGKQRQRNFVDLTEDQRLQYEVVNNEFTRPLPKIGKLRQMLEGLKLESIIELICEMQLDDKAIVFVEYKESIKQLSLRLTGLGIKFVTLTGDDAVGKRQSAVDAFQQDPDVRIFIGTTAAAGVGINLTAANYVFFVSLPWTAALMNQAEDRAYRNGQTRTVIVKAVMVENTIDEHIWKLLENKSAISNDIIDPDEAAHKGAEALGEILRGLK